MARRKDYRESKRDRMHMAEGMKRHDEKKRMAHRHESEGMKKHMKDKMGHHGDMMHMKGSHNPHDRSHKHGSHNPHDMMHKQGSHNPYDYDLREYAGKTVIHDWPAGQEGAMHQHDNGSMNYYNRKDMLDKEDTRRIEKSMLDQSNNQY